MQTVERRQWDTGHTLYKQKKYSKAEGLFRQAADRWERILGRDRQDTLNSKYWLGYTLYNQQKYGEAEGLFRQAADGQERILGRDHQDTLNSKYWLGLTLYNQQKYGEAEGLFRQAADGQERILGRDHQDTLNSKQWLGQILFNQQKYSEAEGLLRQAVDGRERVLSRDHRDTLISKSWLGRILSRQQKYSEAEGLFRQATDGQERILGRDHQDTLNSKYWLGRILSYQQKYGEAEGLSRRAADGQERILGRDHQETLISKSWLGSIDQQKYGEANAQFWQAVGGPETIPGRYHNDMIETLRELRLADSPELTTSYDVTGRLNTLFSRLPGEQRSFTDADILEISGLLKHSCPRWSKVPRTYIVLRTIGHLNLLDKLIDIGFSDYWFPVTERGLPDCLQPSVRAAFTRAQDLVLTKSIDLEKGEHGEHCYFRPGESPSLESKGILGTGAYGQVDKVLSQISHKEYARKRVLRSSTFQGRPKERINQFIAEIQMLKRLKHQHIVEYVGSYTDAKHIGLIMSPVAQMDLAAYLRRASVAHHRELRTFFGCLAIAIEFLHKHQIRHKDIKPANILVNAGTVLLTDFGLSLDFADASGSTTIGMVDGLTRRYCAPEVAMQGARNRKSDIWSLGVVFMEMLVVLKGKTREDMDEFFCSHGSQQPYIHTNAAALPEFIAQLEKAETPLDNRAFLWTRQMLLVEPQLRPTASALVMLITDSRQEGEEARFCGTCCIDAEEDSDWVDK